MAIGRRIKQAREKSGMSREQLAAKIDVTPSAISNYENDISHPKEPILYKLIDILKVDANFLFQDEMNISDEDRIFSIPNAVPIETRKIPLLGTIAAGQPIFADEDFECYVECGANVKADFALRVHGDSMINARINDGDIVFIHKQDMVDNGEIAAVIIDDDATLKRFYKYGTHLILHFENPAYKDIEIELDESSNVRVLGKAVAFQSDVR